MPSITASLHKLVFAMDRYADIQLRRQFGIDHNLFVFLSPLLGTTMDVTGLAASLNLTKAAVSKRVPILERDSWVLTGHDPTHRRRVMVALTPKGEAFVASAGALLGGRFGAMLAGLSIDADRLDNDLQEMVAAVHALTETELS